jgi:hypothetical protein
VLQNYFWPSNEEHFFLITSEWEISIHLIARADSIIAYFPWSGGSPSSFATQSGAKLAPKQNAKLTRTAESDVCRGEP